MKLFKTPRLVKLIYFNRKWSFLFPTNEIQLTFDDGPHPETTPYLLEWLRLKGRKATFFCVGENVRLYPELFQQILAAGHAVGNHTMNHEKGWKTNTNSYIESVRRASELIPSKLFRPPYGKMTRKQAKSLQKEGYTIVMWSWLSYDFDNTVPTSKMAAMARHFKAGDIIVLHDNVKCFERTKEMLGYL